MTRTNLPLTLAQAEAAYSILVEQAGASEDLRWEFVRYVLKEAGATIPREWRFQGLLGFGGKFLADHHSMPCVTCYPEDRTPERAAIIDRVNVALFELFREGRTH